MKNSGIYLIKNKKNNHKYIGKAKDINHRFHSHLWEAYAQKYKAYYYPLNCAIRKYGKENFELSILEYIDIEEYDKIAGEREQYWIEYYNTYNDKQHYNQTQGGEGISGFKHPHTQEWKKAHSERMIGKNNPQYGKHSNGKKVKCIETGEIFPSGRAAAKAMGLSPSVINEAIREGWKAKNYHWERIF